MSDDILTVNDQAILIGGYSATGKSASLRNIPNQERWMVFNTESGKKLPFKNKFQSYTIVDPYQVFEGFDYATNNPDKFDGAILDSVTFLMDMYESKYIYNASNTQQGWQNFAQYFKELMQNKIPLFKKPTIVIAHVKDELDEKNHEMKVSVPIKGSLKNNGVEAYFSTVVMAKKVTLTQLEKYESDLLTITDEEKELGYKHVFQTRPTKETVGERIRSPMGMFTKEQTYMDNDVWLLLNHLKQYYS